MPYPGGAIASRNPATDPAAGDTAAVRVPLDPDAVTPCPDTCRCSDADPVTTGTAAI
ncbi:hypothetical protein ACFQHO_44780 [Actinomadura yumaensis]|uniref:hypothetical protein n=1 Tax=Actinomadura yumaensis TaxID=111807 RepID=UPI003623EFEC